MFIPTIYRKEIAELEEKIDNGFGSESDILRLQEIWRNIVEQDNKEGA